MNMDFLYTFEDIKTHIQHYFAKLCMNEENSFLLFMYGPYIANHMPDCYTDYPDKNSLIFKNDLFRLMYEVALLNKICINDSIEHAKEICLTIINRNIDNPYGYSEKTTGIAKGMINTIRFKQYENKTLESAILNYAPIVQYSGTLVKPEMETHMEDNLKLDENELTTKIISILVSNIIDIMLHDEEFINIDGVISQYNKFDEFSIPYSYMIHNTNGVANVYFRLIFIKELVFNNKIPLSKSDLIKINNQYNKIIKCENVNINEAIEAFTRFNIYI